MNKEEKTRLIFEKYKNLMFHIANSILHDPKLSEDIVQESMIKIIQNLDKINDINCHKTKSFIVIICKRVAIDYYRKINRQDISSFDTLEYNVAVDFQSDDGDIDIIEAIKSLSYIYSEILILKYINELSNSEISKILDISESLVRKRIERAKEKLKDKLIERGLY